MIEFGCGCIALDRDRYNDGAAVLVLACDSDSLGSALAIRSFLNDSSTRRLDGDERAEVLRKLNTKLLFADSAIRLTTELKELLKEVP